ncbi:MAG: glycosyltransferase family 39 protein [Chloroflexota bacterium]|nr:glycosyltransferase family 39 protein [Chloroflexota bacterium]
MLGLLLVAAALQFWSLDAQSLWYDEGFSVWLSQHSLGEIVARTAADIHPPFYYLLLHGWIVLTGDSEWALRFLSAIFALLAVPLMWQLARRLLQQEAAADVVGLFVVFSPLWLWYGREVRMYSLALALLVAAAYLLLDLLELGRGGIGRRWWRVVTFAILATAAVYTHFYVWFVLLAWALVAAWVWLRRRQPDRLLPLVAAFALPLLAYLPWLRVALSRVSADRSYWEGILPLREVVEGALASWMTGHSTHEVVAAPLGWLGGILALFGAVVLMWRTIRPIRSQGLLGEFVIARAISFHHWLFINLWLLLPVVGLYLLSWNRPKYHPRYLIFAAPAFLLLLGALIGWCTKRSWAGRLTGSLLLVGVIAVFLAADWNLFTNNAFAKADWRAVANHISHHRQPDEPILLVSGHAFPIFHYYYPSRDNVLYLPEETTLDTTTVLGLETGEVLADELQGARGAWIVEWQDEVVDPEGVVPALLSEAGAHEESSPFKDVMLSHWRLPRGLPLSDGLEPDHPMGIRFGEALQLLGWNEPSTPSAVDEGLRLMLYWSAQKALQSDYKVRLSVVDDEGFVYGTWDQRPTSYLYPTFRWRPGDPRLAALTIPLEPGTPPGEYWVKVSVYEEDVQANLDVLDEAGAPRGQEVELGPFSVTPSTMGWLGVESPGNAMPLHEKMLDDHELLAARLALPVQLEPGQRLPLTLWWRTGGPLPGASLHLGWERGSIMVEGDIRLLDAPGWPGSRWRAGDLLMTPLMARVPRNVEPGVVRLVAWMSDAIGRQSKRVTLASATVVPSERAFESPQIANAQRAQFGGKIRLLGYDLSARHVSPGDAVTLTLYWEALSEMEKSYKTFAHLLTQDGAIVPGAGEDKLPLDGRRLTDSWVAGEFITDTFQLMIPENEGTDSYLVEVGWYDASASELPRLPASGAGASRDHVLLDVRVTVDNGIRRKNPALGVTVDN